MLYVLQPRKINQKYEIMSYIIYRLFHFFWYFHPETWERWTHVWVILTDIFSVQKTHL